MKGKEKSSNGLRKGDGEKCRTGFVCSEEVASAWRQNESLMTTLNKYNVRVGNLE